MAPDTSHKNQRLFETKFRSENFVRSRKVGPGALVNDSAGGRTQIRSDRLRSRRHPVRNSSGTIHEPVTIIMTAYARKRLAATPAIWSLTVAKRTLLEPPHSEANDQLDLDLALVIASKSGRVLPARTATKLDMLASSRRADINRRKLILRTGAATVALWPLTLIAQRAVKVPRLGVLLYGNPQTDPNMRIPFGVACTTSGTSMGRILQSNIVTQMVDPSDCRCWDWSLCSSSQMYCLRSAVTSSVMFMLRRERFRSFSQSARIRCVADWWQAGATWRQRNRVHILAR